MLEILKKSFEQGIDLQPFQILGRVLFQTGNGQLSFHLSGLKLWNEIPIELKETPHSVSLIVTQRKDVRNTGCWHQILFCSASASQAGRPVSPGHPIVLSLRLRLLRLSADFSSFGKQFYICGPMALRLLEPNVT